MSKALLKTTLCAAAFAAATTHAQAASVTISILDVAFQNPTFANKEYNSPKGPAPKAIKGTTDDDAAAVQWGYAPTEKVSRYEFDPRDTTFTVTDTNPFKLGDFWHFNNPIYSDSKFLETVALNVMLRATFHDGSGSTVTTDMDANFTFRHTETPNRPGSNDPACATEMVGGDCSDQVELTGSRLGFFETQVGDENVALEILGFKEEGVLKEKDYFWTEEGGPTTAPLFARFSFFSNPDDDDPTDNDDPLDPSPVPLPAAAWLLIAGVGSLAATRKLRRKA